ncbi:hypothetical protein F5H01DRAFT_285221 [Linnemannia elongata]|nr:hypothetical protein F5H01DRAFT_285221 [Linnemannia elongata]
MWHDATTGTFSYYDAGSETYIPVEGPNAPHPHPQQQQQQHHQQQHQQQQQEYHAYSTTASSYDSPGGYHVDPYTGYPIETIPAAGVGGGQNYEAPPESDATLRLCVLSSKILKVAGVILLDASGISFGRDRPLSGQGKRVRMIEMEISRYHGSIYLDRQQVIIDCGSTHGTFLNGQRLSPAKTASEPFQLNHLDQLQLGSTVFEIHAHEEGRICGSCQVTDDNEIEVLDDKNQDADGSKASGGDAANGSGSSNKNSPKLDGSGSSSSLTSSDYGTTSGYVDRAAKRRQFNPDNSQPIRSGMPDNSSTPEVVSGFHVPVAKTNKGHAMLSKMGWKAGTGLGAARQGVVEPVQLLVADKKAGLGSKTIQSQGAAASSASRPPETQAEIARRKARERFAQLK